MVPCPLAAFFPSPSLLAPQPHGDRFETGAAQGLGLLQPAAPTKVARQIPSMALPRLGPGLGLALRLAMVLDLAWGGPGAGLGQAWGWARPLVWHWFGLESGFGMGMALGLA